MNFFFTVLHFHPFSFFEYSIVFPKNFKEDLIGLPSSVINKNIRDYKRKQFEKYWNDQTGCKDSKNNIRLNKKHSKYLINLSRTRLKVFTGVTTI